MCQLYSGCPQQVSRSSHLSKEANKAVHCETHMTPTLDEMIADLNGGARFSALDLSAGYLQLLLDEASRYITKHSAHVLDCTVTTDLSSDSMLKSCLEYLVARTYPTIYLSMG